MGWRVLKIVGTTRKNLVPMLLVVFQGVAGRS